MDPEISKALKDLPSRILISSLNDRERIFSDLNDVFNRTDVPDAVVKAVCKLLPSTLQLYSDKKSRHLVEALLCQILANNAAVAAQSAVGAFHDVAVNNKHVVNTKTVASSHLSSFNCLILVQQFAARNSFDIGADQLRKVIEVESIFLHSAVSAQTPHIVRLMEKKLISVWKLSTTSCDAYANFANAEQSTVGLVLSSTILNFWTNEKDDGKIAKFKNSFLDNFIKMVVNAKTKPLEGVIDHSRSLLRLVTHEEFKKALLPAVQRALLRNPEMIMQCVIKILASVSIDLSAYGVEIGKLISNSLHSKEDSLRDDAATACRQLAQQCSEAKTVQDLITHYFAVLNGSEGKLTLTSQKTSVLTAVGNLSYNSVGTNSCQDLACTAAEIFIKFIEPEVYEGTLVHAWQTLSLWCTKFKTDVPAVLVKFFEKALGLKASTPLVRCAIFQCMISTFSQGNIHFAVGCHSVLLKTIEKASTVQGQLGVVSEAVFATYLILCLAESDQSLDSKFNFFWSTILDMDKQLLFSDKLLVQAADPVLQHIVLIVEKLITHHSDRIRTLNQSQIYRALIISLVRLSPTEFIGIKPVVRRLVSGLGGVDLGKQLLKEFSAVINSLKIQSPNVENESGESIQVGSSVAPIKANAVARCLGLFISDSPVADEERLSLALASLIPAHHPVVYSVNKMMWRCLLSKLKLDIYDFLEGHADDLVAIVFAQDRADEVIQNTVRTLSRYGPTSFIPLAVNRLCSVLAEQEVVEVDDYDYAVYETAEGVLYDVAVVENVREDAVHNKNVKRESKAYSYKEQIEEIELKKELAAKKKSSTTIVDKGGVAKEKELTTKQEDAKKQQLIKEGQIRQRLKRVRSKVESVTMVLSACVSGHPSACQLEIARVTAGLIPTFRSPIAAPLTTEAFIGLHLCLTSEMSASLGEQIGHLTIRMLEPACAQQENWLLEPTNQAARRLINAIHKLTFVSKMGAGDPPRSSSCSALSTPAFAYCFCLLDVCLRKLGLLDESMVDRALDVVSFYVKLREDLEEDDLVDGQVDLNSPVYLPRLDMLKLLMHLISTADTTKLQQRCHSLMLSVSECSNGDPGCAMPTETEIEWMLSHALSPSAIMRCVALDCLTSWQQVLRQSVGRNGKKAGTNQQFVRRLWVARWDPDDNNALVANKLWEYFEIEVDSDLYKLLLLDIAHHEEVVRISTAHSVAALVEKYPQVLTPIITELLALYNNSQTKTIAIVDKLGHHISEDTVIDTWEPRCGVGTTLVHLSLVVPIDMVKKLMDFFVAKGLSDRNADVRKAMLDAALALIDVHGNELVSKLWPTFEAFFKRAGNSPDADAVRQSVIIIMASLARHLDKDDPRIKPIVSKLIQALSTPSQQVQEAVANCMHPLVSSLKEDTAELIRRLMHLLLESDNYGERRGAAYGLASIVKGLGILALKQNDILQTLTTAIQNKKNYRHREGALFAFEMLSSMLGRLFEPYIVHVLPHLLLCYGDNNAYVRQATDEAAKVVMSKLSAHGVKLVLPALLNALEETSWRTKAGSVELLGAMAFCAPKQLSGCLPSIVPKLIEVLTDSHEKVQETGAQALKQIGSVIRNPEIQAIVPVLLRALQDPSKKTNSCLQTLLNTRFVHFVDAPSLALIMPVVQRAFQDRSTETRKMAAQIIGNMYSLTDQKDLAPYLPLTIPGLKQSLLDPVPEVRAVSAKALGAMVKGMGENAFDDLLPWLMVTLTSEQSPVDRSGAAQGLSEVVGGLGIEKLHRLMPDIISTAERNDIAPHVKDGYIMMFIYLPTVFGQEFLPYVGQITSPILQALADENEFVRDTALKAGQRIVNMYADSAVQLLLPQLEQGIFNDNWRIRYSSVQLLGDLLYKVSGVSGKMTTETADDDDNFGTETSNEAIMNVLGPERRNRVLSGLYIGRSDVALMVRQVSLHVWKVVVSNTPRTLREILPTLFSLLLGCLASTNYDKRQVAARTLGDLVRKLGERVLPEIIPILEQGLESDQPDQRQGVCIGLSEIMASTSRDMVLMFVSSLVPTVRKALCDPLPEVRQAAAKTFDSLHSTVGTRALDDILPAMLKQLNDTEEGERVLDGLRQVMAVRSKVVLPYLVPQLTSRPVNTKALSILVSVAGEALTKHLNKILPALLQALTESEGTPYEQQELEYCQAVVLSASTDQGVRTVVDELLEATRHDSTRRAAIALLAVFCSHTKVDYRQYVPQMLRGFVHLFTSQDERVLQLSWDALNAVTKNMSSSEQLDHVTNVRQAIKFAVTDLKGQELLPGFCLPKGISPILPIFREAILNGSPDLKEQASQGLGEVIRLTSAEALKPSVVNIAGPLIRILGDRFSWSVKVTVLDTLSLLLAKVGVMLKPFLPQLQTTFMKALNDPHRNVRLHAASALAKLMVIHTRADPLFVELVQSVRQADDPALKDTMLHALRLVVAASGDKVPDQVRKTLVQTLVGLLSQQEDSTRTTAAGCLGALCKWLPEEELGVFVTAHLIDDDPSRDWLVRHGRSTALVVALKEAADRLLTPVQWTNKIVKVLQAYIAADRVGLVMNGVRGSGYLLSHLLATEAEMPIPLVQALAKSINHSSNEVKQLMGSVVQFVAKQHYPLVLPDQMVRSFVPQLVNGTKEKNTVVRANAEYALVALLKLRQDESTCQSCLIVLDAGAREALSDVIAKSLKKLASQPEPKDEDLDDTLLT